MFSCAQLSAPNRMDFLREREIGSFGHDTFLIQATEDAYGAPTALDEVDGRLQVQLEVDVIPFYTFSGILFLLEDEHMVIEELL